MHAGQLTECLGQESGHEGGLHQWALLIILAAIIWVRQKAAHQLVYKDVRLAA